VITRDTLAGLLIAAVLSLALPLALGTWWRSRTGAPWSAWWKGALVFFVSTVVLRIPWLIPLGAWVHKSGAAERPWLPTAFILLSCVAAGVFEQVGNWIGLRSLPERTPRTAAQLGLGHGGLEAMLIGGVGVIGQIVVIALASAGKLADPKAIAAAQQIGQQGLLRSLLAGVERVSTMGLQAGLAVIVLQTFVRGSARWLWLAIALHAGVDALGVFSVSWFGPERAEIVIALQAVAMLWLAARLSRSSPALSATAVQD
jgi:uncharacterized membrane protein YhfC